MDVDREEVERALRLLLHEGGARRVIGAALDPVMEVKDELHDLKRIVQDLAGWIERNDARFQPSDQPGAPGHAVARAFNAFERSAYELLTVADMRAIGDWAAAYHSFPLGARSLEELYDALRVRATTTNNEFMPSDMAQLLLVIRPGEGYWPSYRPGPRESFKEAVTRIAHSIAAARTKARRKKATSPGSAIHVPPRKRRAVTTEQVSGVASAAVKRSRKR